MPSDIFIKTGSTTWSKAKNIFINTAAGVPKTAKAVWLAFTAGNWTKVWPLSGIFAVTDPYITTSAANTVHLGSSNVVQIGTTYVGKNGTWNGNGWTIQSYSYEWLAYNTSSLLDLSGNSLETGSYTTPVTLDMSSTTYATKADRHYLSFKMTANASNSAYNGYAESANTDGRIYVIRKVPLNISYSLNAGPYIEGTVISFSSSWNTTEPYKVENSTTRTSLGLTPGSIKWYSVSSLTNIYAGGGRTEITRASGLYSWTIQSTDNLGGKYIIAEETVFNSGSDYLYGNNGFSNGANQVTVATSSTVVADVTPGAFNISSATKAAPGAGGYRTVNASWIASSDAAKYEYQIEQSSDGTTWTTATTSGSVSVTYANFNTTSTSIGGLSLNYAKFYRVSVRAKSSSGAIIVNAGNNPVSATGTAPNPPTGLNATAYPTYAYISYTAPTITGSNTYTGIQYSTDNVSWSATTTTNPITISTTPGGSYTVYMRAVNLDDITSTVATVSWTAPNTYSFNVGNSLYVGTNGYVSFDTANGGTGLASNSGRVLTIVWEDMVQGGSRNVTTGVVSPTYNINYYCNGTIAVLNWYGYRYASQTPPQDYLNYWVKFDQNNPSYADVYFSSIGANVKSSMTALGMYYNSAAIGTVLNTVTQGYVYRVYFNGSTPTVVTTTGSNFISATDFLSGLNASNYDDGYTVWTTASGQYYTPTVTIGSATATSSSLTFPVTLNYSTSSYDWNLRSGSYSGTIVASGTGATTTSLAISALSAPITYYLTIYPKNDQGDFGTTAQTTGTTSAAVSPPSGGTVSISTNTGNYQVGSVITYSTSGWTGAPTSYYLELHNGTNPVLTSDPLRANTTATSGTYTIASGDVPNYFKAWATATNAGGSTTASSAQVGPAANATFQNPSTPTITGITNGATYTGTWTASTGTTPIEYFIQVYGQTSSGATGGTTGSGGTYLGQFGPFSTTTGTWTAINPTTNGYWEYFIVYARNYDGTSYHLSANSAPSLWA